MRLFYIVSAFAAVGMVLIGQPVVAGANDDSGILFAAHKITATEAQLSDQELSSIVGAQGDCFICVAINVATVTQVNTVTQTQVAGITDQAYQTVTATVDNATGVLQANSN